MDFQAIQGLKALFEDQQDCPGRPQTEVCEPGFQAEVKAGDQLRGRTGRIWEDDEVSDDPLIREDCFDGRLQPRYDMKLGQVLTAEDTYFGLSGNDLSSRSCDELNVSIELQDESLENLNLDVNSHRLVLRSQKYKLFLHLPYKVDDAKGKAIWTKPTLKVSLPIIHS